MTVDGRQAAFAILVVVPTLGRRLETLERTLVSIKSQLGVVVDTVLVSPAATPELQALAERHGASVLVHQGHISAAVNAGVSQARPQHRYAAWLGDDDLLRAGALEATSRALERQQAAVVAYGTCDYIDIEGRWLFSRRPPPFAPRLLQMLPGQIKQETCLFRLSAWRAVGGLDDSLRYAMDLDLLLRLARIGRFARVKQTTAAFCWHAESLTISKRSASMDEAQQIQQRQASLPVRLTQPLWKYPVRWLVAGMSWKINRQLSRAPGARASA